ncbi:hypothetical protein TrispH2_000800 [Trichoplax sp. H2]|nr:hypothetical protein TrispH2_000800 [Trichoplax sp. H2]|eukprot:RDD47717.1 hypothetical protein TrispH2_000800 [Trichoplax sp. H2]
MPAKQRMRIASEKYSKNVTQRGAVPKTQGYLMPFAQELLCLHATNNFEEIVECAIDRYNKSRLFTAASGDTAYKGPLYSRRLYSTYKTCKTVHSPKQDKAPVGTIVLGLFIFLVCGSGLIIIVTPVDCSVRKKTPDTTKIGALTCKFKNDHTET